MLYMTIRFCQMACIFLFTMNTTSKGKLRLLFSIIYKAEVLFFSSFIAARENYLMILHTIFII